MTSCGTLIFFCGKMAAGKSTLAREIAARRGAVLICEDEWLATLSPGEVECFDDYLRYSLRLRPLIKTLVEQMLLVGILSCWIFPIPMSHALPTQQPV